MITINEITINEKKHLTGKIGKDAYSIERSPENLNVLKTAIDRLRTEDTVDGYNEILADTLTSIHNMKAVGGENLVSLFGDDLVYDIKTNKHYLKEGDKVAKVAIHSFFIEKMIEAENKGLNAKPWMIFWTRLMRNKLYAGNRAKANNLITYLKATYLDEEAKEALIENGYSPEVAEKMSTFDQISITESGILVPFKYVSLVDKKYVVEFNKETGEQEINHVDRYKRILEVDPITGKITKDELELPKHIEDLDFYPPIMGLNGGDPFTCREMGDLEDVTEGHVIRVGKVHELLDGFDAVNCNDSQAGVKGLHSGGRVYVEGFGGKTKFLVDCLVAPEDIGAVADLRTNSEGAIRSKRYFVTGGHFKISRSMYHPSKYAEMLDDEWLKAKLEAIENLKQQIEDLK